MGFGLLEKELNRKANVGEFRELQRKVTDLEKLVESLANGDQTKQTKDFYTVNDLSQVMHLEPSTIRKNYIKEGHIEAFTTEGSNRLLIGREEFERVCDIVTRKGPAFLKRIPR